MDADRPRTWSVEPLWGVGTPSPRKRQAVGVDERMNDELDSHLTTVITSLEWGSVVPFLGAGANLCNRLENDKFDPPRNLPSSAELAAYLAQKFKHPPPNVEDLIRLTERIELDVGQALLYERLRELFNADFPTTPLHELLAAMPRLLREKGRAPLQLIVTTNYDDLLERAFRAAGEEVDVITYMAAGKESRDSSSTSRRTPRLS